MPFGRGNEDFVGLHHSLSDQFYGKYNLNKIYESIPSPSADVRGGRTILAPGRGRTTEGPGRQTERAEDNDQSATGWDRVITMIIDQSDHFALISWML